jgi:tyrosinase
MTNYTVFSTDSLRDRGGSYNSLEGLHNGIHGAVGGEWGHMTYTPWSAYDPIFWLHHK